MGEISKMYSSVKTLTDFVQIVHADVESHSLAPRQKLAWKVKGQGQGHENGQKYGSDHNSGTRRARNFWVRPKCTYSLCACYAHGPFITRQDNFCATRDGMTSPYTSIFDFVKF